MKKLFAGILVLLSFTAGQIAMAQNISSAGDLTATKFDELGFDTTGLLGYWQFTGNAHDSSGQDNHGTIVGATATTDRFGTANRAMNFDGNDYITCGTNAIFALGTGSHTFSAFVKQSANATTYNYIVAIGNSFAGEQSSLGIASGNKLFLSCYSAPIRTTTYVLPSINVWRHVAAVYDTVSQRVLFYVNGNFIEQSIVTVTNVTVGKCYIGENVGGLYPFHGDIDEVKVFNRALSADEILALYEHEKGKFSVQKTDNTIQAPEFIEDPALPVEMRSKKESLTVQGSLIEQ